MTSIGMWGLSNRLKGFIIPRQICSVPSIWDDLCGDRSKKRSCTDSRSDPQLLLSSKLK